MTLQLLEDNTISISYPSSYRPVLHAQPINSKVIKLFFAQANLIVYHEKNRALLNAMGFLLRPMHIRDCEIARRMNISLRMDDEVKGDENFYRRHLPLHFGRIKNKNQKKKKKRKRRRRRRRM